MSNLISIDYGNIPSGGMLDFSTFKIITESPSPTISADGTKTYTITHKPRFGMMASKRAGGSYTANIYNFDFEKGVYYRLVEGATEVLTGTLEELDIVRNITDTSITIHNNSSSNAFIFALAISDQ